jgi:triphosphoribosyl-dephospho-CoA synthase
MLKHTGATAELACLIEASCRKPGNVHRFASFADTQYEDFIASAAALRRVLEPREGQGGGPVGEVILEAIRATRDAVGRNTNLGLVLLIVPLALVEGCDLRAGVDALLERSTFDDAAAVYEAIRIAAPGGLGRAGAQDVAGRPTVSLLEAMRLAA